MDIEFLTQHILPQRKKEIEAGENAATRQPLYVVLDLTVHYVSGHVADGDFSGLNDTNLKEEDAENGYFDMAKEAEDRVFSTSGKRMKEPYEVTRFYTDAFVAFFLTREGAKDYLKYQSHNLTKKAYIYTFYTGYSNRQMDALFKNDSTPDTVRKIRESASKEYFAIDLCDKQGLVLETPLHLTEGKSQKIKMLYNDGAVSEYQYDPQHQWMEDAIIKLEAGNVWVAYANPPMGCADIQWFRPERKDLLSTLKIHFKL